LRELCSTCFDPRMSMKHDIRIILRLEGSNVEFFFSCCSLYREKGHPR
jgi:hypothetical protein